MASRTVAKFRALSQGRLPKSYPAEHEPLAAAKLLLVNGPLDATSSPRKTTISYQEKHGKT